MQGLDCILMSTLPFLFPNRWPSITHTEPSFLSAFQVLCSQMGNKSTDGNALPVFICFPVTPSMSLCFSRKINQHFKHQSRLLFWFHSPMYYVIDTTRVCLSDQHCGAASLATACNPSPFLEFLPSHTWQLNLPMETQAELGSG